MTIPPDIQKAAASVYAQIGRGADADEQAIAKALAGERERCAGAVETLIESVNEGLMTDAGLTDADVVAMKHQVEALDVAVEAIRTPHPSPTSGA